MGQVVTITQEGYDARAHECVTRAAVARVLAGVLGYRFAGEYAPGARYDAPLYYVPSDTLIGRAQADALSIRGVEDLFGAVVAHPYVATKSITHGVIDGTAARPTGWTPHFAAAVDDCVLRGYTAFCHADAHRAGRRVLDDHGTVRVKRATGIGGRGQFVASDTATLGAVLAELDADEIAACGLVLEENLANVETYSVGRVEVAGLVATYCGTQRLTPNNHGADVYGGSELLVVRGEFEALSALDLAPPLRAAIAAALRYDRAADAHFDGFIASRRNYDVVRGLDRTGVERLGVLEQSWRIGGASPAEALALEAFARDARLRVIRARTVELYGDEVNAPPGATVVFQGDDARVGHLTKYAMIDTDDADAR
jgi:hypothetical protein